jgi:hypothetical protein
VAGKLGRQGVVLVVHLSHLFYITDSSSNSHFLVDTGSAFSIMPWSLESAQSGPSLAVADGRCIPCWGQQSFTLSVDGVARR